LPLYEFGCIVHTKSFDFFPAEVFGGCLKLGEEREGFVSSFLEEEGDEARVTINKEDVIGEVAV
jgi:hypothetical protein